MHLIYVILKTAGYGFVFLLIGTMFEKGYNQKFRVGAVLSILLYYIISNTYEDYTGGLLSSSILSALALTFSWTATKFRHIILTIIKAFIFIMMLFIIFIVSCLDQGPPKYVTLFEDNNFLIQQRCYPSGAGMFYIHNPCDIIYVDKNELFKFRRLLFVISQDIPMGELKFSALNDSVLQVEQIVKRPGSITEFFYPVEIDLSQHPENMNYEEFYHSFKRNLTKTNKQSKLLAHYTNDIYIVFMSRLKAEPDQEIGNFVVSYGSVYQDDPVILFDVAEEDYFDCTFQDDHILEFIYYSNIDYKPDKGYTSVYIYGDEYNYTDTISVDLTNPPSRDYLLKRKAEAQQKER